MMSRQQLMSYGHRATALCLIQQTGEAGDQTCDSLIYKSSGLLVVILSLKEPITTATNNKFSKSFPIFKKNKVWYFMRIVCQQQTILMKYDALFVIFEFLKVQLQPEA